jgi:hypothetical protein
MAELDDYCREHHLTGHASEHNPPLLPHAITVYTHTGRKLAEAAGWTPELAATAMLRRLHA